MFAFINTQIEWVKDFFDEVQPNGAHKPSMKNLCAAGVYVVFCVATLKVVAFEHAYPEVSGNWLTLLLALAGIKAVGTIAQNLIHKPKQE